MPSKSTRLTVLKEERGLYVVAPAGEAPTLAAPTREGRLKQLAEWTGVIKKARDDAKDALIAVRDTEVYKEAGFRSFRAWGQETLGYTERHMYRLLKEQRALRAPNGALVCTDIVSGIPDTDRVKLESGTDANGAISTGYSKNQQVAKSGKTVEQKATRRSDPSVALLEHVRALRALLEPLSERQDEESPVDWALGLDWCVACERALK